MNEVSVNTIRIFVLMETAKQLARKNAGVRGNFIFKFPGWGRLTPGMPIEKHWTRGGRLGPVLRWVASPLPPLQQIESDCSDFPAPATGNSQWQLFDSNLKLRVLIVCDEAQRLKELRAALGFCQVELSLAASVEELRDIHDSAQFDLAAVDVSPQLIVAVLSLLRSFNACKEATILVESGQITGDPALTGVLPRFRAMPCSRSELLRLVCGRIMPDSQQPNGREKLF